MGLVLWEIVTREAPAEEQLRELRTPAECPEVRLLLAAVLQLHAQAWIKLASRSSCSCVGT